MLRSLRRKDSIGGGLGPSSGSGLTPPNDALYDYEAWLNLSKATDNEGGRDSSWMWEGG